MISVFPEIQKTIAPNGSAIRFKYDIKVGLWGFPGGSGVNNPPANVEDPDSIFDLRRSYIPQSNEAHAPQLLSLCSKAQELQLLKPCAQTTGAHVPWSPWSATRVAPCHRSLHTAARGSLPLCDEAQREERLGSNEGLAQPKANKSINLGFKKWPFCRVGFYLGGVCARTRTCMCVSVPESKSYSFFLVLHVNVKKL